MLAVPLGVTSWGGTASGATQPGAPASCIAPFEDGHCTLDPLPALLPAKSASGSVGVGGSTTPVVVNASLPAVAATTHQPTPPSGPALAATGTDTRSKLALASCSVLAGVALLVVERRGRRSRRRPKHTSLPD